jgi:hypothetical protein
MQWSRAVCVVATILLAGLCGWRSAALAEASPPSRAAEWAWAENDVDLARLFDAVVETVDKTFFDVASSGLVFEKGQRLEGVGVSPDHRVERPLPYANGADPVLDAALELLTKPSGQ